MSKDLMHELKDAEARVVALRQQIASGPCREFGHSWQSSGGRNAGCGSTLCSCSVPVNTCTKCGDCDYGDNEDAQEVVRLCTEDRAYV